MAWRQCEDSNTFLLYNALWALTMYALCHVRMACVDRLCGRQVLTRRLRLAGEVDFAAVAARTPGFVGADLAALSKEAAALAVRRIFAHLDEV